MSSPTPKNNAPLDPDVKVPRAIREAAERANAAHAAQYTPANDGGEGQQQDDQQQDGQQQENQPGGEAQQPTPPEGARQEAPPAPAPAPDEATWEQRARSAQGRYVQAERALRDQAARITELERLLAAQTQQPRQPDPQNAASRLITPAEETEYGTEFLDVASRAAREKLDPEITALRQKLERLEGMVGSTVDTVQRSARDQMQDALTSALPNWREVNRSDAFLDWLQLPDPFSGAIRHDMLKQAYNANQTARVLAFFNGFISDEAATAPARGQPATPRQGKVPLANFAAPGRAKTAAPEPAPAEKPEITRADISQFYLDVAQGKYKGRDEEKARNEAMIFEAEREGRIK